ncbi:hypothetical protein [Thalassospira profundimaris]|uniref:Uncharacterized protein n=1 Tax=Thalassospira profundimaris TaxID=502049 RepID=A0A367WSZ3_9PROT|nr:hypothetical protein [Thalassospira profundimaris]RCK44563.1 hypothetical protein TH30_14390 [Thalassospira profundimaris]
MSLWFTIKFLAGIFAFCFGVAFVFGGWGPTRFISEIVQFPVQLFEILISAKLIVVGYWFLSGIVMIGYIRERKNRSERS